MIDPLTGFAVAGNVLQFADLGIKLIWTICNVYRSTDGLEDEYTHLQTTAQNVRSCNLLLEAFSKDLSTQQGHAVQALLDANNACLAITTKVASLIEKVAPQNASKRLRGSVKSAFRRLWNQQRCDRLDREIANAQSNVSMGLLTYMTMQATANQKSLSEAIATSTTQTSEQLEVEFTGLHDSISGVESLTKSLSAMAMHAIEPLVGSQNERRSTDSPASSESKLNAILKGKATAATPIQQKVADLDRSLRRGERNIMASLHFSQMDARRDQIRRIHPKTMQWVFSRKSDSHPL